MSLPDELCDALVREARRRSTSASAIAREAIASHLHIACGKPRTLAFAAIGHSGRRTTAREMEQLIAQEWGGARRS